MRRWCAVAALGLVWAATACDKVSPVAPTGSSLTVSAEPTLIEPTGSSQITAVGRREDGQPFFEGTVVFFATNLGSITDSSKTNDEGVAFAILGGDGRAGVATVTVTTGAATPGTIEVQVGSFAAFISMQATPTIVTQEGGTLDLLALVRGEDGRPLPDAVVNFVTEFGILASGGGAILTDSTGEATDLLSVSPADVAAVTGTSFTVTASTAGSGGDTLISAAFEVSVATLAPIASFSIAGGLGNAVFFNNTSIGAEPLAYAWDFDDNGSVDSTAKSPTHDYGTPGVYTARLVVTNALGTSVATQTFTVPL